MNRELCLPADVTKLRCKDDEMFVCDTPVKLLG